MARRVGRLPTPWTVSTPHRPSGISVLSNFYDRQVLFTGIPAVPAAGNCRRVNLRKKTRERTRPCGASSNFSCLCSSRLSCFRRAGREAFVTAKSFQMGTGALRLSFPNGCPGRLLPKEAPRRTQTYKPDSVCNAGIPPLTGPGPVSAISAGSAHRINYNFCIPQYIVDVKI